MNHFSVQEIEDLETKYIDKFGVKRTLAMIEEICYDKAHHVESNWQDSSLASVWDYTGKAICKMLAKLDEVITQSI